MTGNAEAVPSLEELARLINAAKLSTLGMLVAGVAHEINTPMGALNSNHDTLKRALAKLQDILADDVVTPEELDEVRRIVRALDGILRVNDLAVTRMRELVQSLRNFGRPDQGEVDRIDLHETIDGALAILSHQLSDRIAVRREYGHLPEIDAYGHQLSQVFMNLLLNAIQAIPERGVITITTATEGECVRLSFTDTGSGISSEHVDRIFEPGFTTKGTRVGMGLGLLISRQVVERHGGTIAVRSEPGHGSRFEVRLPVHLRPESALGAQTP